MGVYVAVKGVVKSLSTTCPVTSGTDHEGAIEIATVDATKVYRNLEAYTVEVGEARTTWLVDFRLKDPKLNGGVLSI